MSVFFFLAAGLSLFYMDVNQSWLLKVVVVGASTLIGLWLLIKRSEARLWIENESLHCLQADGSSLSKQQIPIRDIKTIRLVFSGSHGGSRSWVRHKCYVITENQGTIELPSLIKYSAYNPHHAHLNYLLTPLRVVKNDIGLEIDDTAVIGQSKPDFSHLK